VNLDSADSAVEKIVELLEQLVAVTPAPEGGSDPSELAETAARIAEEREPLCAALGQAVDTAAAHGARDRAISAGAPLVATLADMDARWSAALTAARVALAQRTSGDSAARRYYR
jgi:hypothetical protein